MGSLTPTGPLPVWLQSHIEEKEGPIPIQFTDGPNDHVLVTQYSSNQMAGKTIPCHVRCKMGQTHKENHSKGVHISCHRCGARATVKLFRLDEKMVLGKHALRWVTPRNLPHNVGVRMIWLPCRSSTQIMSCLEPPTPSGSHIETATPPLPSQLEGPRVPKRTSQTSEAVLCKRPKAD